MLAGDELRGRFRDALQTLAVFHLAAHGAEDQAFAVQRKFKFLAVELRDVLAALAAAMCAVGIVFVRRPLAEPVIQLLHDVRCVGIAAIGAGVERVTVLGAGRLDGLLCVAVAEGGNELEGRVRAVLAGLVGVPAVIRAGGGMGGVPLQRVTGRGDGLAGGVVAPFAGVVFRPAVLRAGRRLSLVVLEQVAELGDGLIGGVGAVSARVVVLPALRRAGGGPSAAVLQFVAGRGNRHLGGVVALCAAVVCLPAFLRAGGGLRRVMLKHVAVLAVGGAAQGADRARLTGRRAAGVRRVARHEGVVIRLAIQAGIDALVIAALRAVTIDVGRVAIRVRKLRRPALLAGHHLHGRGRHGKQRAKQRRDHQKNNPCFFHRFPSCYFLLFQPTAKTGSASENS